MIDRGVFPSCFLILDAERDGSAFLLEFPQGEVYWQSCRVLPKLNVPPPKRLGLTPICLRGLGIFTALQKEIERNDACVSNRFTSGISSVDCIGPQELENA